MPPTRTATGGGTVEITGTPEPSAMAPRRRGGRAGWDPTNHQPPVSTSSSVTATIWSGRSSRALVLAAGVNWTVGGGAVGAAATGGVPTGAGTGVTPATGAARLAGGAGATVVGGVTTAAGGGGEGAGAARVSSLSELAPGASNATENGLAPLAG